jgi:hypothetical protein
MDNLRGSGWSKQLLLLTVYAGPDETLPSLAGSQGGERWRKEWGWAQQQQQGC